MHLDLTAFFFIFIPAMIKDISFLGRGNIIGMQQLTVYCIPIPQTVSYLAIIILAIISL